MATTEVQELHYLDVDNRYVIWCDIDGTNVNTDANNGRLRGATVATSSWVLDTGLTEESEGQAAVTIDGVLYAINTVASISLSVDAASYVGESLTARNIITTSDGRTLNHTLIIAIV